MKKKIKIKTDRPGIKGKPFKLIFKEEYWSDWEDIKKEFKWRENLEKKLGI